MARDERRIVWALAVVIAAVLGVAALTVPVPRETEALRLGWVGAYGRVTPAGRDICAEHRQRPCTWTWLEAHAAEHAR